jgi:hypothetical protein
LSGTTRFFISFPVVLIGNRFPALSIIPALVDKYLTQDKTMAHKLTTARVRLPPIYGNATAFIDGASSSITRNASREAAKKVLPRQQNIDKSVSFPPIVQPPSCNQHFTNTRGRKTLNLPSVKIRHVEKIPTNFPGKTFAVLPPIAGKRLPPKQNQQRRQGNPSQQPKTQMTARIKDENQPKSTISTSASNKPIRVARKQISFNGKATPKKQEDEVSPTAVKPGISSLQCRGCNKSSSNSMNNSVQPNFDFKNADDDDDDDDDDDRLVMKLFEALQFLEWSSELREFLNGDKATRRNATCPTFDPMLCHAVDVIRDILLRQTMEDLCMMW